MTMALTPVVVVCAVSMLLATGTATATSLAGTWSLGTNRFTIREKPEAICHGDTGKIVLMSGKSHATGRHTDTWEGTPNSLGSFDWAPVHTSPIMVGREAFTMNYALGEYWVFGGKTDNEAGVELLYALIDGRSSKKWVAVTLTSSAIATAKPEGRYRHHSVSLTNGSFIIFSGNGLTELFNDVWMFSPTSSATGYWTELHNGTTTTTTSSSANDVPTPRFNPCCQYRSSTDSMVCFGGSTLTGDSDELWEFFIGNRSWTLHTTSGTSPSPRRLAHCNLFTGDAFAVWSGFSSGISNNTEGDYVHVLSMATLTWANYLQSAGPITRDGAATCGNSTHQFLLAGLGIDRGLRNDVWLLSADSTRLTWKEINSLLALPSARAEHSAAMIGSNMVIGFGKDTDGALADVWKYDTESQLWEELSEFSDFGARSGAAAVARGDQIWFIGGKLVDGTLTMDMISFDITSQVWGKIPASNAPTPRHRAAASSIDRNKLILVGGSTEAHESTSDIWIYTLQTQTWYAPSMTTGADNTVVTLPPRYASAIVQHQDHLVILGGAGTADNLMDRWQIKFSTLDAAKFTYRGTLTNLTSTIGTAGLQQRSFRRGASAFMGTGKYHMQCGGTMSPNFPTIDQDSCYQYNHNTGVNIQVAPMPTNAYYPTGVYFGHTFYVFGGTLIQGGVAQSKNFIASLQMFNFTTVCTSSKFLLRCAECSPGTAGPDCAVVPAGTYKTVNITQGTSLCPKGQYAPKTASQTGLFCQPCHEGFFQNQTGQSSCLPCDDGKKCPVGAATALDEADVQPKQSKETHPPRLADRDNVGVPLPAYFGVLAFWAVFVALLFILLAMDYQSHIAKKSYYMGQDRIDLISDVFNDVLRHELDAKILEHRKLKDVSRSGLKDFITKANRFRGLDDAQVKTALICFAQNAARLDGDGMTEEDAKGLVPEGVVRAVLTPFEAQGVKFIGLRQFQSIVCAMYQNFYFKPVQDTLHYIDVSTDPETNNLVASRSKRAKPPSPPIFFEHWDDSPAGHALFRLGESLSTVQTRGGGVLSIVSFATIVSLLLLTVIVWWFDNMVETMSINPDIVVKKHAITDFTIDVEISGSSLASDCVQEGTDDTCVDGGDVAILGTHLQVGATSVACTFISPRGCRMLYTCNDCHMGNESTSFEFVFADKDQYSVETAVTFRARSGIAKAYWPSEGSEKYISTARRVFTPANSEEIFKGYPSSSVDFIALSTLYRAPKNFIGVDYVEELGYHVSDDENVVLGNEIKVDNFRLSRAVPVVVKVKPEDKFLVVQWTLKKDALAFVSSLLAVVSGIGTVAAYALSKWDNNFLWMKLDGVDVEQAVQKILHEDLAKKKAHNEDSPNEQEETTPENPQNPGATTLPQEQTVLPGAVPTFAQQQDELSLKDGSMNSSASADTTNPSSPAVVGGGTAITNSSEEDTATVNVEAVTGAKSKSKTDGATKKKEWGEGEVIPCKFKLHTTKLPQQNSSSKQSGERINELVQVGLKRQVAKLIVTYVEGGAKPNTRIVGNATATEDEGENLSAGGDPNRDLEIRTLSTSHQPKE